MTHVPKLIGIVIRGDEGILARRSFLGKRIRDRFGIGTNLRPRRQPILEVIPVCSSVGRKREMECYRIVVIRDHIRDMISGVKGLTEHCQCAASEARLTPSHPRIHGSDVYRDSASDSNSRFGRHMRPSRPTQA